MSNPTKPLVSILIPAFNQERFIEKTIESALSQTYKRKEVVVADDCSADKTCEIIQKYQNHPCVKVCKNTQNLGMVANHRRLLYNLASGKYAVMLDGDDYFIDNNFIAKAISMAEKHNLRLVFTEAQVIDSKRNLAAVRFPFEKTSIIPYPEIFKNGVLFMHGAVLFRRDLALNYNFYSYDIIGEDNVNFLRFIIGEKVGFLKQKVYTYHQHNDPARYTITQRVKNNLMVDTVFHFGLAKKPHEKALFNQWRAKMLSTIFYGHLIHILRYRKFGWALEYFAKYLREYGVKRLILALKNPFAVYQWVYQRSLN